MQTQFWKRAKVSALHRCDRFLTNLKVQNSIRHVSGLKYIDLPDGEVVVILLGRNMGHYLDYFHDHYTRIGAKYFIYADNGSVDDTLSIVSRWRNTVVLSTDLNFRIFQTPIRQAITTRYCSEGWRLAVDPDELFDYVGSDHLAVQGLAASLLDRGFTGLVAQMLDMVPESDLATNAARTFQQSANASKYFSLDEIESIPYYDDRVPFAGLVRDNILPEADIEWKFGGLRRQYFGENCCLTKHALYYHDSGVKQFVHPHLSTGLKLADFTALLRHYKFSGDFLAREAERITNSRISHNETEQRAGVIGRTDTFSFDASLLDTDSAPETLIDRGFLVMSEAARLLYS